jgi:hypothetical protein
MFDFTSLAQGTLLAAGAFFAALALAAAFTATEPDILPADVEWRTYQACGFTLTAFFFLVLFRLSFSCL